MVEKTKVEWALELASRGFLILELKPNSKVPVSGHGWSARATSDHDTIRSWFEKTPDMNYGACSNVGNVVIDLDVKPERGIDGRETYYGLVLEKGSRSDMITFCVTTANGGEHIYLTVPDEVANANRFEKEGYLGIDVRGVRGYVVGPGCSLGEGKDYTVSNNVPIAPCPDWLYNEFLVKPGVKNPNRDQPLVPWDLTPNIQRALNYLETIPPAVQ
jgi:hypothetical protein